MESQSVDGKNTTNTSLINRFDSFASPYEKT